MRAVVSRRIGPPAAVLLILAAGCTAEDWGDDHLYHASRQVEARWSVADAPAVTVQLNRGDHIKVTLGDRGVVAASVHIAMVSKISQGVADERVRLSPGANFEQDGDVIRIIDSPNNLTWVSLDLVVPPGCDLDLRGPDAEICVGCDPLGAPDSPIPAVRLKAATKKILNARVESASSVPPDLDLEGGRIDLTLDGAAVPVTEWIESGQSGRIYKYRRPL